MNHASSQLFETHSMSEYQIGYGSSPQVMIELDIALSLLKDNSLTVR